MLKRKFEEVETEGLGLLPIKRQKLQPTEICNIKTFPDTIDNTSEVHTDENDESEKNNLEFQTESNYDFNDTNSENDLKKLSTVDPCPCGKAIENWKIIEEMPDYEISDHGRVKSSKRLSINLRKLFTCSGSKTTHQVTLRGQNKTNIELTIRNLVARAFCSKPSDAKFGLVNIDGNRLNDHAENLKWMDTISTIKEISFCETYGCDPGKEIWKSITGYPNYEVSDHGRVRNIETRKLLSTTCGFYYVANLRRMIDQKIEKKRCRINILVAIEFCPQDDKLKKFVNHINGIKKDNHAKNLEWTTSKENNEHAIRTGLRKSNAKTVQQLDSKTLEIIKEYKSVKIAATELKMSISSMHAACKSGNIFNGFKWKFTLPISKKVVIIPNEIWKAHPIIPFLVLSDYGRYKLKNGKACYGSVMPHGYRKMTIAKKSHQMHRLIAETYLENSDPLKKTMVNHINKIKDDNRVVNLEWITPAGNAQHSRNREIYQYSKDRVLITTYIGMKEASEKLGISRKRIGRVANGHIKTAGGFIFTYVPLNNE